MPASQLYDELIVGPTKNTRKLFHAGPGAFGKTPAELGLVHERSLQPTNLRQTRQQFDLDAAMWYGAIMTGPNAITALKLFHLFYYAGVIYKKVDGWGDWALNRFGNLASLLSHGGRVLVQIPPIATRVARQQHARAPFTEGTDPVWAWLQSDAPINRRGFATHGLNLEDKPREFFLGHKNYLKEEGGGATGALQSLKGHLQGRHYSFNVALGGEGNRNPFSASNNYDKQTFKMIRGDGLNGHVYINYKPPTTTQPGGMLVGCENAEHGKGENPHSGAGHGLGGSQKVSPTGGLKWTKTKLGPMKEYGGMICDLTDRAGGLDWVLGAPLLDPNLLDGKPRRVASVNKT